MQLLLAAVLVIAHRGLAGPEVSENTIASFRRAVEAGAEVVEFDVRRTRDGVLVIAHDETIMGKRIAETDMAQLPRWRDGSAPARLDEVVAFARERKGVMLAVELKESGYEQQALDALAGLPQAQWFIMSFRAETVRAVKKLRPAVRAGLIRDARSLAELDRRKSNADLVERARRMGADWLVLKDELIDERLLAEAGRRALPVYVWYPNSEGALLRWFGERRLAGVITDRPDLAVAVRKHLNASGPGSGAPRR